MEYNKISNVGEEVSMSNSGNFADYEFVPAVIIDNNDPMNYGRVKVTAPGIFNGNNTDPDLLPWCYPWIMIGNASYSSLEKGTKVWLLKNKKRQDECWYIPMHELYKSAQEYVEQHEADNPEIISSQNNGGENDSITYNKKDGYTITSGGSTINSSNNGASVSSGGGEVKVDAGGQVTMGPTSGGSSSGGSSSGGSSSGGSSGNEAISIGSKDISNGEPVVMGYTLNNLLVELLNYCISILQEITAHVPEYNADVAATLTDAFNQLSNNIPYIYTYQVYVSESNDSAVCERSDNRQNTVKNSTSASKTEAAEQQQEPVTLHNTAQVHARQGCY